MTVIDLLEQSIKRPGLNPQRVFPFESQLRRQRVRRQETDAAGYPSPVDTDFPGLRPEPAAVVLVYAHGERGADAVRLQKLDQRADPLMFSPTIQHLFQL